MQAHGEIIIIIIIISGVGLRGKPEYGRPNRESHYAFTQIVSCRQDCWVSQPVIVTSPSPTETCMGQVWRFQSLTGTGSVSDLYVNRPSCIAAACIPLKQVFSPRERVNGTSFICLPRAGIETRGVRPPVTGPAPLPGLKTG